MRLQKYINESGVFKIDENGILWEFIANIANVISAKTYKSLIIPNEVKGFSDEFGREFTVVDKFQLPCTLWDIGVYMHDWANAGREIGCVFANCNLPRLLLPEEIVSESAGAFAFGNSYIQELCVPESYDINKWSARSLKGCTIGKLYVPESFKNTDDNKIDEPLRYGALYLNGVQITDGIYVYSKREVGEFPEDEHTTLIAAKYHSC